MRHKHRPIRSSSHKSVTLLADSPMTSFEHNNVRHMNDVMRLAFLENNDIAPETWKDTDFNSLSTACILKRNIQQQLQQELSQLKEQQEQARQQQHLLQQLLQQQQELLQRHQHQRSYQNHHHHHHHNSNSNSNSIINRASGSSSNGNRSGQRRHQVYQLQPSALYYDDNDESQQDDAMSLDYNDAIEDQVDLSVPRYKLGRRPNGGGGSSSSRKYDQLSDSSIFATALPTTSSASTSSSSSRKAISSAPMAAHQATLARATNASSASRNRSRAQVNLIDGGATLTAVSPRVPANSSGSNGISKSNNNNNISTSSINNSNNSNNNNTSHNNDNSHNNNNSNKNNSSAVSLSVSSSEPQSVMSQNGEFLCSEPNCGKSFPSLRKLRHHKVVHSDDFPFHCQFKGCEKKFKRKFGIDLHSTTHFDLDPEMYNKTSNSSSSPFFGRRMQYSMCKPCGQKFKTVLEYQHHMLNHGKEPFKCPVKGCGQTFSIWKSFQKHRASHYFNYYCKMDPRCEHFTSNLQLLKLHIYCCHFQRKLPDNATLSSKDALPVGSPKSAGSPDRATGSPERAMSPESGGSSVRGRTPERAAASPERAAASPSSQDLTIDEEPFQNEIKSRLRRNPPRSSTFVQQDYASISNGSNLAKITREMASPSAAKRARTSTGASTNKTPEKISPRTPSKVLPRRSCATSATPKRETLPLKVLPKRSAQRMPMSLIAAADGESTEDENGSEPGSSRNHSRNTTNSGADINGDSEGGYRCHLCDYKFSVRFQLTKHLSTHLELSPDMYSAVADPQVIQISERRRREFYCDKCNVKFESMLDLDSHMRKHGQRPYVCSFCQVPSTFKLAKQYLSHLYEHRFNYKCTMSQDCDFTINRRDALKLHIFRMHMNQKLPDYIENFAKNMVDPNDWAD